ncbi:MAG: type II toxin-antitoxin system VapC family toxin [bacterium]|nr:type II toxin-antitoxin system VapC family toxin [bacterium]
MTLDTNIVIAYLAGESSVVDALTLFKNQGGALLLPTIVEAEVLSFSKWSAEERTVTERFLEENFVSIPCDRVVARIASRLRTSSRIRLPDAIIAASALSTRTPLATRNIKDFKNVVRLELFQI